MSLLLAGFGALLALALANYAVPQLARRRVEAKLLAGCRDERALVLSYDDGPGPELTPRLLELLRAAGARATFFPVGSRAQASPGVLDRVRAEGHEIGSHSFAHASAWTSSPRRTLADVAAGFAALAPWLGERPLFRPPHGKSTLVTWLALRRRRARLAWWTHDSGDTFEAFPDPDAVCRAVARDGGGVVLLHDFDRTDRARAEFAVEVTRRLLALAKQLGLRVIPLGELLCQLRPPRVLAIASGGGHWVQLRRLEPALAGCDVAWATVDPGYRAELTAGRFWLVPDATRWDRFGVVRLALRVLLILLAERPDVVVSTGAAPGYFALAFGRALGARTVWIDSIANVEELSLSGVQVRRFADLWLTQWPHLARPEGPRYEGSVL